MNDGSLSVLVPAFNEEENLEPTVDRLLAALGPSSREYEIVIVNDGSGDGTAAVADRLGAKHQHVRVFHNDGNRGLGFCYLLGVEKAQKRSFVYIPGDNTWPLRSFVQLFGSLGHADVITSYSTNPEVRPPMRRFVSAAYTRALNLAFGLNMHYYNGLTVYPTELLRSHPVKTHGFGFQAEALLEAIDHGFSVIEIPLPIDERTVGRSKAVTLRNIASVLATFLRMWWRFRLSRLRLR